MSAAAPHFELRTPADLAEVLGLLGQIEGPAGYRPLAGGTDLMVLLSAGKLSHRRFVNVWGLRELGGIEAAPEAITLGALTTYSEVQGHQVLRREFPLLCQAASETGGWAIQNRGTLGGNIANASPAADSPPALLVYEAEVELCSAGGSRWVPYAGFHTGYKQTVMDERELITRIRLPRRQGPRVHFYRKVGPRKAQAISKVCFAGCADHDGGRIEGVRVALGGVAPVVVRCVATEGILRDEGAAGAERAAQALGREIAPIDDVRSTARYRRRVAENLLGEFVRQLHAAAPR